MPVQQRRQEGCVDKYSTWVDRTLHDFFFRVGAMNAASPWRSIGLSMHSNSAPVAHMESPECPLQGSVHSYLATHLQHMSLQQP